MLSSAVVALLEYALDICDNPQLTAAVIVHVRSTCAHYMTKQVFFFVKHLKGYLDVLDYLLYSFHYNCQIIE